MSCERADVAVIIIGVCIMLPFVLFGLYLFAGWLV